MSEYDFQSSKRAGSKREAADFVRGCVQADDSVCNVEAGYNAGVGRVTSGRRLTATERAETRATVAKEIYREAAEDCRESDAADLRSCVMAQAENVVKKIRDTKMNLADSRDGDEEDVIEFARSCMAKKTDDKFEAECKARIKARMDQGRSSQTTDEDVRNVVRRRMVDKVKDSRECPIASREGCETKLADEMKSLGIPEKRTRQHMRFGCVRAAVERFADSKTASDTDQDAELAAKAEAERFSRCPQWSVIQEHVKTLGKIIANGGAKALTKIVTLKSVDIDVELPGACPTDNGAALKSKIQDAVKAESTEGLVVLVPPKVDGSRCIGAYRLPVSGDAETAAEKLKDIVITTSRRLSDGRRRLVTGSSFVAPTTTEESGDEVAVAPSPAAPTTPTVVSPSSGETSSETSKASMATTVKLSVATVVVWIAVFIGSL